MLEKYLVMFSDQIYLADAFQPFLPSVPSVWQHSPKLGLLTESCKWVNLITIHLPTNLPRHFSQHYKFKRVETISSTIQNNKKIILHDFEKPVWNDNNYSHIRHDTQIGVATGG